MFYPAHPAACDHVNPVPRLLECIEMKIKNFLISRAVKGLLHFLVWTCRLKMHGLDRFLKIAENEKCILMLWHNRLCPIAPLLYRLPSHLKFAALVSGSKDGEILADLIQSYKNGSTIRAFHLGRYKALREVVRQIDSKEHIVIITPDGPRGPRYEIKPGVAMAALETEAYVFPVTWSASTYWELKTWDKFRIPKPFTTIELLFGEPICFTESPQPSLEEAINILKKKLGS